MTSAGRIARRERVAVVSALVALTLLAWLELVAMADMPVMGAGTSAGGTGVEPWSLSDAWMMFAMWAVMMVGMMVPSATPMALLFTAVSRKAASQGAPVASTLVFVSGYVAIWTLFSASATAAQWGLDRAALLSPMLVSTSPALGASLLVGAGLYQLTPFKDACLEHCRSPAHFLSRHWKPGVRGAFRLGLHHGAYCLGCCWVLMGLLFFGGVMNLLWIGAITLFVLLEKALPAGRVLGRVAGVAMIAAGGVVLARGVA